MIIFATWGRGMKFCVKKFHNKKDEKFENFRNIYVMHIKNKTEMPFGLQEDEKTDKPDNN